MKEQPARHAAASPSEWVTSLALGAEFSSLTNRSPRRSLALNEHSRRAHEEIAVLAGERNPGGPQRLAALRRAAIEGDKNTPRRRVLRPGDYLLGGPAS
jgi:hypothetical protein